MSSTFWDYYAAAGYDALRLLTPYEALQQAVVDACALTGHERLLVAGCGTGNLECLATRRFPRLAVDALDFSPAMLARARAKCADRPRVRHLQADLCAGVPLPDAGADVAVMCNVLYALPDQQAALREIHRVVRPGGRFVLCDRQPWSSMAPIVRAHLTALRALPVPQRAACWLRALPAFPRLALVGIANARIQRRHRAGAYTFHSVEEITRLLAAIGFDVRAQQSVYAEQCWLVCAERRPAEEQST